VFKASSRQSNFTYLNDVEQKTMLWKPHGYWLSGHVNNVDA
jgi:hypothetical protein